MLELVRLLQPGCICRNSDMSPGPSSGNASGMIACTHLKSESPWSRVVLLGMFLPKILGNGRWGMLVSLDHHCDRDYFKSITA